MNSNVGGQRFVVSGLRKVAIVTLFFIFHFSFFVSSCQAQVDYSNDSLRVVSAEWSTDTLEGFYLRRYHFGEGSLFCSAQNFCLVEIPARSHRRLAFVTSGQCTDTSQTASKPVVDGHWPLSTVSEMAEYFNAYAAVNGSYFDMQYGNPVCYLRVDGEELGENTPSANDSVNRKYYQYATISLHDGRATMLVPDSNRTWEQQLADSNVMTAGPMLLFDGKTVPQRDDRTFVTRRHNRTALGTRPDGTTLLLVADGRFRHNAEGLTLNELAMVMRWLGCNYAINLDGGGSTTMYIRGRHDHVVNHPSDNNRYDHKGQRPVANAILVL